MNENQRDSFITGVKQLRKDLDAQLQVMKAWQEKKLPLGGRQLAISITDLESSIMRLGMVLKDLATENPYPNSYKPENTVIDPTADGLKL